MKGWTWLLIILAAILAAIIAVCVWTVKEVGEEQELEVLEHQLREEFWGPVVVGTAMNDTEQELSGVKAEVKWYGPGDVVLETDSDYLFGRLQPGDSWRFEVMGVGVSFEEVSRYELEVTGIIQ